MIISDACTINIINDAYRSVNDSSRSASDACTINSTSYRVVLQIVASLTYNSRGVIYSCNMFIVAATGEISSFTIVICL
jgi:hypothetical protein